MLSVSVSRLFVSRCLVLTVPLRVLALTGTVDVLLACWLVSDESHHSVRISDFHLLGGIIESLKDVLESAFSDKVHDDRSVVFSQIVQEKVQWDCGIELDRLTSEPQIEFFLSWALFTLNETQHPLAWDVWKDLDPLVLVLNNHIHLVDERRRLVRLAKSRLHVCVG